MNKRSLLARAATVSTLAFAVATMSSLPAIATPQNVTVGIMSTTADPARCTFPVTLNGFSASATFNVVISTPDALLDLPHRTGLTGLTGYPALNGSETEFGFRGTLADITAALDEVGITAESWTTPPDITVVITESPGDNYFYNAENGHYYEFVQLIDGTATTAWDSNSDGQYSWTEARDSASSMSLFGQTGYLVTITSESENDFVAEKTNAADIWIGAARRDTTTFDTNSNNPGLIFEWKTGPESGTAFSLQTEATTRGSTAINGEFSSWATASGVEPNNYQYEFENQWVENYVVTNWLETLGEWNDLPNEAVLEGLEVTGFLVEYGGTGNLNAEYAEVDHTLSFTNDNSSNSGGRNLADTGFSQNTLVASLSLGVLGIVGGWVMTARARHRSHRA